MTAKPRVAVFQSEWQMQSQTVYLVTSLIADGFEVDVFLHQVVQRYDALPAGRRMAGLRVIDFSPELELVAGTAPRTGSVKSRVRKRLHTDSFPHRLYYFAGGVKQQIRAAKETLRYARRRSDMEYLLPNQLQERTWQEMQGRIYCALIGVERVGIVWAGAMADRVESPLVYFSLELYTQDFPHDPMGSGVRIRCLNRLEAHYHRLSQATIIQDAARAEVLLKDNDVVQTQLLFLPVSLLGPPLREKSELLHRMLNLPPDQHLLLVFGKIASRRFTPDLVRVAQRFPDDWTLVIHEGGASPEAAEALKAQDRLGRIAVSTSLVSPQDLPAIISSADIGLVFYASDTQNEYLTGRSSEKAAQYARAGVPMIAFNYPSFAEIFAEYRCGCGIESLEEVPRAAAAIFSDYDTYRQGAWLAYEQVYEFSKHFQSVTDWLEARTLT